MFKKVLNEIILKLPWLSGLQIIFKSYTAAAIMISLSYKIGLCFSVW